MNGTPQNESLGERMIALIGELEALGAWVPARAEAGAGPAAEAGTGAKAETGTGPKPETDAAAAAERAAAPCGLADRLVAGLSDQDALAGLVLAERLGKMADSLRVLFAGEISARCGIERGDERLSVRNGFPTAAKLMAACTGTSIATATSRAALGTAVRPEPSFSGGMIPSRFPHVEGVRWFV